MAEEKFDVEDITTHDDASVLRMLLHSIKGLSPVSGTSYVTIPVDDDDVAEVSYS